MSWDQELVDEPWRFDMFAVLRRLEQVNPDQARIGQNATLRDEVVRLGQDPFMAFPSSNLDKVRRGGNGRYRIIMRFLGLLGPQGALPLATTAESLAWLEMRDDAFARFLDVINGRFLQLFYRAWADARPIAQHARPDEDRFVAYIGSSIGIGREMFRGLDSVPDGQKLLFAGLAGPSAKSAVRLEAILSGALGLDAHVYEFVGSSLPMDVEDQAQLGKRNSRLGDDLMLGSSCYSVSDKIRIRLRAKNLADFERVLPNAPLAEKIADLVLFYLGEAVDWDVELALPESEAKPMALGRSAAIGWTSWLAPKPKPGAETRERVDARFDIAERVRARRNARRRLN